MELRCGNCGHLWESEVESLAEYEDGPRCSECNSRDVTVVTAADGTDGGVGEVETEAVRRFRSGETPLDLVEDGVCSMERAEALRESFNEISSEMTLITGDRLEEIRERAWKEGHRAGQQEGQQSAERAYQQGQADAWQQARAVVRMGLGGT